MNGPNTLYYGDNLESLRKHIRDETVDLCYIDPPFNSKRTYNQIYNNIGKEDRAQAQAFVDTWIWDDQAIEGYQEIILNKEGRFPVQTVELIKGLHNVLRDGSLLAYLVSMTRRIVEIHRVLKRTGTFYFHCDPTSSHYLKIVIDGVFCSQGGDFLNEIVWKRTHAHGSSRRYGPVHDTVLFYSKTNDYIWTDQHVPHSAQYVEKHFKMIDPDTNKRFAPITLTGSGVRNGESGKPWRGVNPTKVGRHWALPGTVLREIGITEGTVQQRLDALDDAKLIYWPNKSDGTPRLKWFAENLRGQAILDIWTDISPISANAQERLGYPTQKPEELMERIIQASSEEGDVVLDAYCGCGTTIAVAQRLKRLWIGMDITFQSISLVIKRLEESFGKNVADAVRLNGAPRDIASAEALAHKKDDRLRKEFEKWAVLTYTGNRAAINQKKGADKGIDGTAYFLIGPTETDRMVFQVKSGKVGRGDIAKLNSDRQRENAALAALITLEEPTTHMRSEAKGTGSYVHPFTGRRYPHVQIITVREIIEERKRLDDWLPLSIDALKTAPKAPGKEWQHGLPFEGQA